MAYVMFTFVAVTCAICLVVGRCMEGQVRDEFQQDAIERGYARYNDTTGDWEWKEGKKEKD